MAAKEFLEVFLEALGQANFWNRPGAPGRLISRHPGAPELYFS
jgi:hypothetical protein